MPSLGADMAAGTVTEWLVKPGDRVKKGQIVAVVETEKADIEVEIFSDGMVKEILVPEGKKVPVGTALATVGGNGELGPPAPPLPAEKPVIRARPAPTEVPMPLTHSPVVRKLARELGVDLATVKRSGPGGTVSRADVERASKGRVPDAEPKLRLRASPLARRAAFEMEVDLSVVPGTGPGGTVTERDVRRSAPGRMPTGSESDAPAPVVEAPEAPKAPRGADRQLAMRLAIGALMARSKREVPHYYLASHVDMSNAMAWLGEENATRAPGRRLLSACLMLKAVALACRDFPEMNGFWVEETFRPGDGIHLGVAISLRGGGLIAPAIHDVDQMTLDQLMAGLRDLVARARAGRLRGSEMSDPTITVTNLGDQGVEEVFGVIYAPQVALVGFGKIIEAAWAENGMVGARPMVTVTLSADHRASDGHGGGLFLSAIDRLLQKPEEL
jgi:pyruvate dehydrogenase E2 component (dihydrolipoamide acetyltransferase)